MSEQSGGQRWQVLRNLRLQSGQELVEGSVLTEGPEELAGTSSTRPFLTVPVSGISSSHIPTPSSSGYKFFAAGPPAWRRGQGRLTEAHSASHELLRERLTGSGVGGITGF